eukprot:TRINITY_DN4308_c0_g1_i2.p3 TRINITY_DN4308_c0_g1~~TRINITY_DN4308_c0_g1_i2.p3  ORF type:complete len:118 (-),score=29.68 TRINITY_DN4308_c0_g1_i2:99-452(-)
MLSLLNFRDFCCGNREEARKAFEKSTKGKVWFFFAVAGIHVTCWLCNYLQAGILDKYFYTHAKPMEVFQMIYEKALIRFVDFWVDAKPKSIMDYSEVSKEYQRRLKDQVSAGNYIFI